MDSDFEIEIRERLVSQEITVISLLGTLFITLFLFHSMIPVFHL